MLAPFFERLGLSPVRVAFEEIVPNAATEPRLRRRAVYRGLIEQLPRFLDDRVRADVENRLRPFRRRAWDGRLGSDDFHGLLDAFLGFKRDFRRDLPVVDAYSMINSCAALIAQVLFVDNCFAEGMGRLSHPDNHQTLAELERYVKGVYQGSQVAIDDVEARAYAHYFLTQTFFDRIFVGDEEVLDRDPATGQVRLTPQYGFYTSYLELSNSKLVTATDVERALCQELTTGWGDGIDVATWNALNQAYYGRSEDNFFSAAYDEHLDKMIPQFAYSKVRAAEDVAAAWDGVQPVQLVEIGAGSGAFAVDLFMALKRQGKDRAHHVYRGVEPSPAMNEAYRQNFLRRVGQPPPAGWEIVTAGLEEFLGAPELYLSATATNVIVLSYAAHHCFRPSLLRLVEEPLYQERVATIYVLDGLAEHGWTKVYYMPLDCRSPEDFRNVSLTGRWRSETLWQEPFVPLEHHAVSRAWCALRRLTPPRG